MTVRTAVPGMQLIRRKSEVHVLPGPHSLSPAETRVSVVWSPLRGEYRIKNSYLVPFLVMKDTSRATYCSRAKSR